MAYDPFAVETGLIGNVDVTFTDAEFTNRLDAFDPTKLELHLTALIDGDDGGEQVLFLGCGDGWEAKEGGKVAVREDGKERNFHGNTKAGELMKSIVALMSDDKALDKELRNRLADHPTGFREAGYWIGLKFHLERKERKGSGDVKDFEVLVASKFNGVQGGGAAKAGGTAKKAAGATKKAAGKAAASEGGVTAAIRKQLDDIADASADHDSFMEAAFAAVAEASTDEAVKAAVSDDGEGSIWADAVARYEATQA